MGVEAVVEPVPFQVETLAVGGAEVRIANTGPRDDEFSLAIDRHAAQWGWVSPPRISVPAGRQVTAKVQFRFPKAPNPPAGPLPYSVTVTSLGDPAVSAAAEGVVEVAAIRDSVTTLNPRTAQGSGPSHHVVGVSNRGNAPIRVRLSAHADGGALDFDISPVTLDVPAGGVAEADLRVSPSGRLRRGTAERPFEVIARADGLDDMRADGVFTQEGAGTGTRAVATAVVLVGLIVGGTAVALAARGGGSPGAPSPTTVAQASAKTVGDLPGADPACPARGHDNRDRATSGGLPFNYSFLFTTRDGCQPLRFDPCTPIRYIVNPTDAPPGGVDDVRQAFRMIAEVGGYSFEDMGTTTTDRFDFSRAAYDPQRYGEAWAPIVVSWSRLGSRGRDDVVIAGRGNGQVVDGAIVTGMLDLNADARIDLAREVPIPAGFGTGISWGRVILHELGHVFGLGHVESKNAIMHEALLEQTLSRTEYGVGDIQAWRLIGRQAGCGPVPTPRPVPPLGASRPPAPTTTTG